MTALQVNGLRHLYAGAPPVLGLSDVDLAVADGSLMAVLGPSGCGKTTLLRALAGTLRPDSGIVRIGGEQVVGPRTFVQPERRGVTLVPQDGALFPHLDVAANVAFGLRQWNREARRERVEELLALVGLDHAGRRRPDELSGGQQQRVALARALAPRPQAVLLDEPFSALDATLRTSLREDVAALLRTDRTTAVLVTHDRDEALSLADAIAVMGDGEVLQMGPTTDVYHRPVSAHVARTLGDVTQLPGQSSGTDVECALGRLPLGRSAPNGPATVLLRPEQVVPSGEGYGVAATVVATRFRGPDSEVTLNIGAHTITARWPSTRTPATGGVRVRVEGPVVVV